MTTQELHTKLETLLAEHKRAVTSDPQANPVKLLAYDISKAVEQRSIAFRDIEASSKHSLIEGHWTVPIVSAHGRAWTVLRS